MKKLILFVLCFGWLLIGSSLVWAGCEDCASETDCVSEGYATCEDFEGWVSQQAFCNPDDDCNDSGDCADTSWHDLEVHPGSANNCSEYFGEVSSAEAYNGTYSYLGEVRSQSSGSPSGYKGMFAYINDVGSPTETWLRYYMYVPSSNYYGGSGSHCNHFNFMTDGAGAYPALDVRHYFWRQEPTAPYWGNSDYSQSGWSGGNDGKLYIGIHSTSADYGGERFEGNYPGDDASSGPSTAFALSDHFDEWICVEYYVNNSTKRMKLWINGTMYADTEDRMTFSKTLNGFNMGAYNCLNNDVGTTWKIYYDNIALSTTGYIGPLDDPPADTTPPTTSGWSPAKSAVDVDIDEDIVVHISDSGDGVDGTTIEMTVEGTVYCPSDGTCGNKTLGRTGTPSNYIVTHSHASYGYATEINVSVDADDLAAIPNSMTTDTYSYTTESFPDVTPPATSGWVPVKDDVGVNRSADIEFHVTDGGDGVDGTSIEVTVEGTVYCCSDGGCSNKTLSRSGTTADYLITYTHTDWGYGQQINVSIDAEDLDSPPNVMTPDTYSFTVETAFNTVDLTGGDEEFSTLDGGDKTITW